MEQTPFVQSNRTSRTAQSKQNGKTETEMVHGSKVQVVELQKPKEGLYVGHRGSTRDDNGIAPPISH